MERLLVGQNTIKILGLYDQANPDAFHLGNLFISIGGYNISIGLRTTDRLQEHVSNIIFDVDGKTRNHMIEAAVKRKTETLAREYNKKVSELDKRAKELSLKHVAIMATSTPYITKFKESGRIVIGEKSLEFYADKVANFGNEYYVLLFDIENKTNDDYTINGLTLTSIDRDNTNLIKGVFNCPSRLNADTLLHCSFATQDNSIKSSKRMTIKVNTDRGAGDFTW